MEIEELDNRMNRQFLEWARSLQAHSQNGLYYAKDPFDKERYGAVQQIAAEMMATLAGVDVSVIDGIIGMQAGYATPKIDVRCATFRNGRILLVRERSDGMWTLPGGWADVDDSPSEAVERELWEESGYRGQATKVLAVWDRRKHGHPPHAFTIYKIVFHCGLTNEEADIDVTDNPETDGVAFFAEDELPSLSVGRVTEKQIQRLFEHHRNPDLPTDFD